MIPTHDTAACREVPTAVIGHAHSITSSARNSSDCGTVRLKRNWAGEVRNVSLLVAIGVNERGYREILGICEGAKEDKSGWSEFLKHLKERGLKGVRLITSDACIGLTESAAEFFPEAAWQRCIVGSLKKWVSRRLYAVAGSASVARIGQALGEGVQTEIGLNRANQGTKGA